MPAGATPENSSAAKGFKFCSRIFSIEKRLKELPDEERLKARTDQVTYLDEYTAMDVSSLQWQEMVRNHLLHLLCLPSDKEKEAL